MVHPFIFYCGGRLWFMVTLGSVLSGRLNDASSSTLFGADSQMVA